MKHYLLLLVLISTSLFSQNNKASGDCSNCNDSQNFISHLGNGNFTSTTAQAYFWEICQGNASINGSNTNQTVSCTSQGIFTIKVTKFLNGNCIESCEVFNINSNTNSNCPTSNEIYYLNEGGGGLCTTGLASISGLSNVNYVNWTWALGGYSGTMNTAGTTTPIYYPSGNWSNYYISICAQVVFNDGTTCDFVCKNFLLDCGYGVGSFLNKTRIYPNPSNGKFSIKQINDSRDITNITLTNSFGKIIKPKQLNFKEIDLSNQDKGLYIIKISFNDGSFINEKIILE